MKNHLRILIKIKNIESHNLKNIAILKKIEINLNNLKSEISTHLFVCISEHNDWISLNEMIK